MHNRFAMGHAKGAEPAREFENRAVLRGDSRAGFWGHAGRRQEVSRPGRVRGPLGLAYR
jgi:hypothetical protein